MEDVGGLPPLSASDSKGSLCAVPFLRKSRSIKDNRCDRELCPSVRRGAAPRRATIDETMGERHFLARHQCAFVVLPADWFSTSRKPIVESVFGASKPSYVLVQLHPLSYGFSDVFKDDLIVKHKPILGQVEKRGPNVDREPRAQLITSGISGGPVGAVDKSDAHNADYDADKREDARVARPPSILLWAFRSS